jgi:hypothetical protein
VREVPGASGSTPNCSSAVLQHDVKSTCFLLQHPRLLRLDCASVARFSSHRIRPQNGLREAIFHLWPQPSSRRSARPCPHLHRPSTSLVATTHQHSRNSAVTHPLYIPVIGCSHPTSLLGCTILLLSPKYRQLNCTLKCHDLCHAWFSHYASGTGRSAGQSCPETQRGLLLRTVAADYFPMRGKGEARAIWQSFRPGGD